MVNSVDIFSQFIDNAFIVFVVSELGDDFKLLDLDIVGVIEIDKEDLGFLFKDVGSLFNDESNVSEGDPLNFGLLLDERDDMGGDLSGKSFNILFAGHEIHEVDDDSQTGNDHTRVDVGKSWDNSVNNAINSECDLSK